MSKTHVVLVSIFAVLAVGIAGYILTAKNNYPIQTNTSLSSTTPTSDTTANWKTYTNQNDGYTLQYPPNWHIANELSRTDGIIFSNSTNQSSPILVGVYVVRNANPNSDVIRGYTSGSIQNKIISKNGKTYILTVGTYGDGGGLSKQDQQLAPIIFTQMLSSFKLTSS